MKTNLCIVALIVSLGFAAPAMAQLDLGDSSIKDISSGLGTTKITKNADTAKGEKGEPRAKGPTEITATEASFDQKASIGVFTTDVIVKDPEFDMTCKKLTVYLKKPAAKVAKENGSQNPAPIGAKPDPEKAKPEAKKSESGLEKSIAEGDVVIIQEKPGDDGKMSKFIAKGDKAIYEAATGNLTLYGSPEIIQSLGGAMAKKMKAIEDGCIMILNRDGRIDTKNGRATTTIMDGSGLDGTKDQ